MGNYLYKLIEEKKELQKQLDKYNQFIDKAFGRKDYFARRHMYYNKIEKLRKEIKNLNKKIDFMLNLSDSIKRGVYAEQNKESNRNK